MTEEEVALFELSKVKEQFDRCRTKPVTENVKLEEFFLPASDGVKLKMIVYRPEDLEGPFPTITVRTCYPKNDAIYRATAVEYARRGWAYVIQYCRGSGDSKGVWDPNVNERPDGKVFIDWVAAQPWVASIGYTGCSYLSLTGWAIADILPDKVKTMYLTNYGCFRHTSAYKDGLFRHDVLTGWAMQNAGYPVTADYIETCKFRPHEEVDEKLWGKRVDWYRKWVTSNDADDEYWNTGFWGLLKEIPTRVTVPIYFGEGWFDHHLGSALETYKALPEETKKKSRLLIGAWNHNFDVAVDGHKDSGKNFENDDILRTFYWMEDILVNGKTPEGSIDTYIIGDDSWYSRSEYDIKDQPEKRVYLTSTENRRGLSESAETPEAEIDYVYDPDDPVPSVGAEACLCSYDKRGSLLQPEPDYRSDVISFVSEPLTESFTTLGSIKVTLDVATDCEDTAFAAKICEVMADGKAYNIRTSITTLGYRNGAKKRVTYTPGEEVTVEIDMWDLAWKFQKGSRIRIDVTSSDFPQYVAHSNQAGCWAKVKESRIANQKVFVGKGKSYISFPILEM